MKTEKRCKKMPSIDHLRSIVFTVKNHAHYIGKDENGDAIYDETRPKPTLLFKGSVKLHGTNNGISYNHIDGMWYQSKDAIITPQNDNAGAAFMADANKKTWLELIYKVKEKNNLDLNKNTITIYGEWAGKRIQKGVGICQLDKSMFIFGVKITPFQEGEDKVDAYWVDCDYLRSPEHRIYNIFDYETFEVEIDFNDPQVAQEKIDKMVLAVENECPVAKAFGFPETIGEGIVFVCNDGNNRYVFKAKGEKHSKSSKVKEIKPTDDERTNKLIELAQKVCIGWRLEQMLTETFDLLNDGQLTRAKLGDYIKAVIADVVKEESDILVEAGFEIKDVSKYISEIARDYFFQKEKEFIGI